MNEFSLENIADKIHYGKSKKYFDEVLSSYNNGNYRSSVVMLWSVAVCDIVYKLQNLVDLYSDRMAEEILNEVSLLQERDSTSSTWEIKLIENVFDKTNLLDSAEYENLRHLQKQRHLSAHPVLNKNRELHSPNKETVRSLLRNTLEGLLIKPPFYTQKIIEEFLEDIAENKAILSTRKKIKIYLESRYLNRLTSEVELSIFRCLWKLVFKLVNDECDLNRKINYQCLELIAKRKSALLPEKIEGDKDYFSNLAAEGTPLELLIAFLSGHNDLYNSFSADAQLKIQHCVDTGYIGKALGWFLKDDLDSHYKDLVKWIESEDRPNIEGDLWELILEISDSLEWQKKYCELLSIYYSVSSNYNDADERFIQAIESNLHLFDIDSLIFLLSKIEPKDQAWSRGAASSDHPKIVSRIHEVYGEGFDYKPYPYFKRCIRAKS